MKRFSLSLWLSAALLLLAVPALAQASKVGFVNPQRIINESKIGKIAQEDLARLGKEKDRRVRKAMDKVNRLQSSLKEDALSVSEQQSRETGLRQAARDYEQLVRNSNQEIQNEERQLIRFVMRRADPILKGIAREQGFTMILTDPEIIGYVDNSLDITDRVISELNSML
ncbi:OmpH family outer membrane protein [Pseudodesulfovibrio methanolicus]|uniref:OmpH family outer membrane protein n=1 Tax=Pseudodesulfovibrio methanolicus TaxID=3126690 RepID=A0ABZ2IYM3_9BACT